MKPFIYVAGPFTAEDEAQKRQNSEIAIQRGEAVVRAGGVPIVPHAAFGRYEGVGPERVDAETFWYDVTRALMLRCDAVWCIDRWRESLGAQMEEKAAQRAEMPCLYSEAQMRQYVARCL